MWCGYCISSIIYQVLITVNRLIQANRSGSLHSKKKLRLSGLWFIASMMELVTRFSFKMSAALCILSPVRSLYLEVCVLHGPLVKA